MLAGGLLLGRKPLGIPARERSVPWMPPSCQLSRVALVSASFGGEHGAGKMLSGFFCPEEQQEAHSKKAAAHVFALVICTTRWQLLHNLLWEAGAVALFTLSYLGRMEGSCQVVFFLSREPKSCAFLCISFFQLDQKQAELKLPGRQVFLVSAEDGSSENLRAAVERCSAGEEKAPNNLLSSKS